MELFQSPIAFNHLESEMRKVLALTVALLAAGAACAQELPKTKKAPQAVKKISSPDRKPTGPSGLGPVKIGMTKEDLEALQSSDGIYLAGRLIQADPRVTLPEGATAYKGSVRTPLDGMPIDGHFYFGQDNRLYSVSLSIPESAVDQVTSQITEKYGKGKVEDTRKEEQCIYRNGSNFKLTSGTVSSTWIEPVSVSEKIVTRVMAMNLEVCPSSLRYGTAPLKSQSLSISKVPVTASEKPPNLF